MKRDRIDFFFKVQEKSWQQLKILLEQDANSNLSFEQPAFKLRINRFLLSPIGTQQDRFFTLQCFVPPEFMIRGQNKLTLEQAAGSSEQKWSLKDLSLQPLYSGQSLKVFDAREKGVEEEKTAIFLPIGETCKMEYSIKHFTEILFDYLLFSLCEYDEISLNLSITDREMKTVLFKSIKLNDRCQGKWNKVKIDLLPFAGLSEKATFNFSLKSLDKESSRNAAVFISKPLFLYDSPFFMSKKKRQNVVLVCLDTVRADHLSAYGYRVKTSPCLKDIAQSGVLFKRAYSPAPWTLPAHISLFTGQYSSRFISDSKNKEKFNLYLYRKKYLNSEPLAKLYHHKGYLTAAFTGSGYVNSILGFSHGFDLYVNDDGQEDLEDKTDRIFMKGLDWIQEVSRKANFFLFLHTYEAHQPHLHRYFIKDKFMGGRLSNHKNMTRFPFDFVPTSEEKEFAVNLYDSSLFHLDQYLGILMDKLERMKLLSNTLIIILSDHGEDIWDHKTFGHGEMYKEVLHVPLIFYNFLGTRGGTVIENLVSLLDLYPTLAEVHDLKLAKKSMFDGIDLSYLLQEQKPLNREKIFSECLRSLYAKFTQYHDISVMDGHYHYIQGLDRRYSSAFLEEFFSVKDDIFEKYDLSESFSRGAEDYRRACRKLFLNIFRSNDPIPCAESAPYSKIEELELAEKLKSLGYL